MKLLRTPDDRLVAAGAARFARVVVANTGLPTGDQELTQAFLAWQRVTITRAGHFLQEDAGPRLAAVIAAFIEGQDIEETK